MGVGGGTTTNYIWDGWDLIREEKSGVVTETTDYLCPAGEVLAFKRDGDWYYLHGDGLSSTQLITDASGAVVGRYVYGAWGDELVASESLPGVFENRFVGGLGCRRDPATGLVYMRHRWYDVQLQRFISRDPIGRKGGWNFYRYARNNPVDNSDHTGLSPMCELASLDSPEAAFEQVLARGNVAEIEEFLAIYGDLLSASEAAAGREAIRRALAPVLEKAAPRLMFNAALNALKAMPPGKRAAAAGGLFRQVAAASGGTWSAQVVGAAGGASAWYGPYHTLVIDRVGNIYVAQNAAFQWALKDGQMYVSGWVGISCR